MSSRSRDLRRRWLSTSDLRGVGSDPDYRFSLANERTFLAWIRTALALGVGGLGAATLLEDVRGAGLIGIGILVLSLLVASTAYRRWVLYEKSMRLAQPLPRSRMPMFLSIGVSLVAVAAVIVVVLDGTT
jgi:putative membrane protein